MLLGPAAVSPAPPRRLGAVDAASTPARSTFELTAGMSDVDAYAFLYYAQYVKYNERAASEAAGSPLVLSSVESMIFGRPARWGESINVVTFLCPPAACEEEQSGVVRLLHAWVADSSEDCSKPDVCNTSVMSYSKPPGAALAGLDVPRPGHPLYRPLMACLRENRTPTPQFARCEPLATSRQRELCVTVHPDAIGCGGRLQPSWAFDLFERQRTAIIGGQSALKSLQSEGVAVVVCRLRGLKLLGAPVLGERVQCVSAETSSCNGIIFDVLQRIVTAEEGREQDGSPLLKPTAEPATVLAECVMRMVFLRDGEMAPPPAHILRSIDARRETEGGPGEDEGGPGEDPLALDGESIPWEVPSTPPTLLFALGDELEYEDAFTFPKAQHGMPSPSSVMHGVASHRDAPPPKPLDLGVVRRVPEPQEPRRALPRRHSLG